MRLIHTSSVESLGDQVVYLIEVLVRKKSNAVIGWPSGRSTLPVLEAVVRRDDIDLSGVTIAMMDEYAHRVDDHFVDCDPAAHYSCHRWVERHWNSALVPSARPEVLIPSAADSSGYEQIIEERGCIDLFLVAIGTSDGHVAFNPPGTPSDSRTRVVQIARSIRMDNLGAFPEFIARWQTFLAMGPAWGWGRSFHPFRSSPSRTAHTKPTSSNVHGPLGSSVLTSRAPSSI